MGHSGRAVIVHMLVDLRALAVPHPPVLLRRLLGAFPAQACAALALPTNHRVIANECF